jgi:DNA invertase Pin-like site-specific DNA recombinase
MRRVRWHGGLRSGKQRFSGDPQPLSARKLFLGTAYIAGKYAMMVVVDLVGYVRVSSDGQIDGFGLPNQEQAIRAWAEANGHRLVKVCRDEGVPGTVEVADRPGLRCALDAISDGDAKGLVIARLDRLARSLTVQEGALLAFWKHGARVFTADTCEVLRDDPDDPMRTAIRQVFGVFAQLDRAMVTKRLRDGRAAKAKTGRHAVGPYAYGYKATGKGRERDAGPDDAEQVAVRRILDLRQQGRSYRQIVSVLEDEGLAPRRAEHWSPMSVRSVAMRAGVA